MTEHDSAPPLLAPVPAGEWGPDEYAAVGALFGMSADDVPRAGSGHPRDPLNFDILGVLARHPKLAKDFMVFNAFLLQRGELPSRLRELASLRLAHTRRSTFFWGEHVKVALAGGLTEDDVASLARGNSDFNGADRLVLDATDELLAAGQAAPSTWQRLVEELGTHQAMELVFVVGTYAMLSMACATWRLAPPSGTPRLPGR